MTSQYQDICRAFKIGCWTADISSKRVMIDNDLVSLFNVNSPIITFSEFVRAVTPERRDEIRRLLDSLPHHNIKEFRAKLTIKNRTYQVSIILDIYDTSSQEITGALQIENQNTQILENTTACNQVNNFNNIFSTVVGFAKIGYCKWDIVAKEGFAIDQWYLNWGEKPGSSIDQIVETYTNLHPEDRDEMLNTIKQITAGKITSKQNEVRVKDGDAYRWVYHSMLVTKYEPQNSCIEIVGVNIEISHHKETELKLIEATKQATSLSTQRDLVLNNLLAAMVCIDSNYIVQWETTKALRELYPNSSFIPGQLCYHTAYQRMEPCENCPLTQMLESGKRTTQQTVKGNAIIEITANPTFNDHGQLIGGVVRFDDITKRKKNERKIKELNNLMDAILNNIPVYVFVKDPNDEFRYLYWNKAMAKHTSIPIENVIGKTDVQVFPDAADAEHFRADDLRLLESGKSIEFEEEFLSADGTIHTAHTVKTMIPSEGEIPWVMGVSWDITDLKQKEQELVKAKESAEESDRFKSTFLANMSHEIRTPLNAIVGFSELLIDNETSDEDRAEYLSIIQTNNQLLLQLISDILDLSKIEAHVLEIKRDVVDIKMLCDSIVTSSSITSDIKVPIIFDETSTQYYVLNDENRIHQVIINFVTNAIKFTKHGSIKISYKLISETELEISVTDTGQGIPSEKINSIFDRFVKLDSFVQGTGLGLSICKNLVEQLGGRIGVESQYGVGSRFWFTLPYDNTVTIKEEIN